MGETRYPLGYGEKVVRFGYDDYRYGCLCTFPFNYFEHKFGIGTVESLVERILVRNSVKRNAE